MQLKNNQVFDGELYLTIEVGPEAPQTFDVGDLLRVRGTGQRWEGQSAEQLRVGRFVC